MIRRARADEAGAVHSLVWAAYQPYVALIGIEPAPMRDDYAARVAAGELWVLEDKGMLAGILVLEDGPDQFLLDNIAVLPDRKGAGIGRRLLDFAEAEALRRGRDEVTLYTNALMVENIAIYAKRGYQETGRRREKGFDRVYMAKRLGSGRATDSPIQRATD